MTTMKTAAIGALLLALLAPAVAVTPAHAQEAPQLQKCLAPYQEATVTNAATPEYPSSALSLGRFFVLVQVSLSPTGQVVGATIYKTSGNADADQAAIVAARQSTFQPRINNCIGESAEYVFRAEFVPPKAGASASASANPACATPDHTIKVVKRVMPVIPASLKGSEGSFQAVVDVKVDAQGNAAATIAQSTGNADVDQAILAAAQKTTYLPAMQDCKPVASEAWFHAGFGPKATPAPSPGN